MYKDPPPGDRINCFALVSYIPDPLAGFLDRLRQELVPNCFLRAHVTILTPRPISSSPEAAWNVVQALVPRFAPFQLEMTGVDVFPVSDVIYINIAAGNQELQQMHAVLNVDGLHCAEPFAFHPHVTLAQDLQPDEVDELTRVARARWAECSLPKTFRVEKAFFVQKTSRNQWIDLGESVLGEDRSKLVGELEGVIFG